jgi:flagella basal body P-ring formation protein FlgA
MPAGVTGPAQVVLTPLVEVGAEVRTARTHPKSLLWRAVCVRTADRQETDTIMMHSTIRLLSRLAVPLLVAPTILAGEPIQALAEIEAAVREFTVATIGQHDDVEFSIGRLDPRLRLAQCSDGLSTRNVHPLRHAGSMSVEVRCTGHLPWVLYVSVNISRYADIVVTARPLARDTLLARDDLEIQRSRIETHATNTLNNIEPAVGQVTIRALGAGQILSRNHLRHPRLVRRGQHVMLSMGTRAIKVRVKGEALEDGIAGERIRVLNLSSERIIHGVVKSAGEVVVGARTIL